MFSLFFVFLHAVFGRLEGTKEEEGRFVLFLRFCSLSGSLVLRVCILFDAVLKGSQKERNELAVRFTHHSLGRVIPVDFGNRRQLCFRICP